MKFEKLVQSIQLTSEHLQQSAIKAVNINLTLRNWLIGYYIVEFEQNGEDRAVYGSNLLNLLSTQIKIKGLTAPELSRCRQFYNTYSGFLFILPKKFNSFLSQKILGSLTQKSIDSFSLSNLGSLTQELYYEENQNIEKYFYNLFSKISYTHFVELIKIKDATKRKFYELLENIKSVKLLLSSRVLRHCEDTKQSLIKSRLLHCVRNDGNLADLRVIKNTHLQVWKKNFL